MGFLLSVNATCCSSSQRGRKSSGAMCSLSVYSAFTRHPVAQAAFWKAVFIGAFLFMLRGGRSALTALCWIRSIWPRRKTLGVSMCVRESVYACVSAGGLEWYGVSEVGCWQVIIVTSENAPELCLLSLNTKIHSSMSLYVYLSAFPSHILPEGLVTVCFWALSQHVCQQQ